MVTKFERLKRSHPSAFYQPEVNPLIGGVLKAWAQECEAVLVQIDEAHDQLFVTLADGKYLEIDGRNYGVGQLRDFRLDDDRFREFIPIMSYFPKQIKKTMYQALDIFWGPSYSRSTIEGSTAAPYNFSVAQSMTIKVDNNAEVEILFDPSDFTTPAIVTAAEAAAVIAAQITTLTSLAFTDYVTNTDRIRLYTNTVGSVGSIQVTGGTAATTLGFASGKVQSQQVSIYEINHKELIVKVPFQIPLLTGLIGSHHFHPDATLVPGWPGGFFYPNPLTAPNFILRSTKTTTSVNIDNGDILSLLAVTDSSGFPNASGLIVFDFGSRTQETVRYFARPNNVSLAIDPSHIFEFDHLSGGTLNLVTEAPCRPATNGSDYPIIMNDTSFGESIVLELIQKIKAAGVIVRLEMVLPNYLYQQKDLC